MNVLSKRWKFWTLTMVGLIALAIAGLLVQRFAGAPRFGIAVLIAGLGLGYLWGCFGIVRGWPDPLAKRAAWALAGSTLTVVLAVLLHTGGYRATAIGILGIWAMATTFLVGLQIIKALLAFSHPITGVARTFIAEAVRVKIAVVCMALMMVIVAVMPLLLNSESRLQYRIQTFLSWSIGGTGLVLALMTIFLTVRTITSEVKDRQIFMTMTKPVRHWHYLLGKFIGIALINVVLLTVAGFGIYAFARILEVQPAMDGTDRAAVYNQVLTARATIRPQRPKEMNSEEIFQRRLAEIRAENPQRYGDAPSPELRKQIESTIVAAWHTIPPGRGTVYYFPHVGEALKYTDTVQLRLKPRGQPQPPDKMLYMAMRLNGVPMNWNPVTNQVESYQLVSRNFQTIDVPLLAGNGEPTVDEDGGIALRIDNINLNGPRQFDGSIFFEPDEGLEMLYTVGTFEGNLFRALVMLWLQLCFFAMLGLAAGSFLGFPVATLFCIMAYVGAGAKDFLVESLRGYAQIQATTNETGPWTFVQATVGQFWTHLSSFEMWEAGKVLVRVSGEIFLNMIPSFSKYQPASLVADGRVVSPAMVGDAVFWILCCWTLAVALLAWAIFTRRELARVIV